VEFCEAAIAGKVFSNRTKCDAQHGPDKEQNRKAELNDSAIELYLHVRLLIAN
jgi:hypothetical protein